MVARKRTDWIVDLSSVFIHFFVAPVLQIYVAHTALNALVPGLKGSLPSSLWVSLVLYAVVDYSWYWNHRLSHSDTVFWSLHRAHHLPETIDVFATSRNPLITHFFRVYLWLVGLFVYLLDDPTLFLSIAACGSVIIFWGHTNFCLPADSIAEKTISAVFATPRQHLWHHSRWNPRCNFGSVLSLWDRIHGTLHQGDTLPESYGSTQSEPAWRQILWPF